MRVASRVVERPETLENQEISEKPQNPIES